MPLKEQMIDFNKFLLQFNSIDEIKSLTPIILFDIDSELLEQLKEKCRNSRRFGQNLRRKRKNRTNGRSYKWSRIYTIFNESIYWITK